LVDALDGYVPLIILGAEGWRCSSTRFLPRKSLVCAGSLGLVGLSPV